MNIGRRISFLILLVAAVGCMGCQSIYYNIRESLGTPKRDILVSRVQAARDSQQEAGEQFASALEQFRSVIKFGGGTLEEKYNKLQAEYNRSEARADEVSDRIAKVEDVAEALFDEWKAELKEYSDADLRRQSERQLDETMDRYEVLIAAMKEAEDRIPPVLNTLRDRVLFLKHNLNARAVGALEDELDDIEADVSSLIKDMDKAVAEANKFLSTMK